MNIEHTAFQVLNMLKNETFDDKSSIELAIRFLEDSLNYCKNSATQNKDLLMQFANESGHDKFKLIGKVNTSGIELMEWCDEACNFDFMCPKISDTQTYKDGEYLKRTYTLKELPNVIDNALNWYNSVKKNHHNFNSTMLHILCVDDAERLEESNYESKM